MEEIYHFSELQWKSMHAGITERVPGPIKEEIMNTPCRDYKVDIDSS